MKPIIVPTDFSSASLNAVNYAADLAVATNSNLLLVHVFQLPVVYGEVPVAAVSVDEQIASAERQIKDLKEQIAIRTSGKINVDTDVKANGAVVREIENYCKSLDPSFVVMGSHGGSTLERMLFGSNIVTAMKKLSWPLIIVPGKATFKRPGNIGFACDLINIAETVPVDDIRTLVQHFGARLHVIHINTDKEKSYPADLINESAQVSEMFEELHPVYSFLDNENIEEGLSEYAEKNDFDLLIVIPKEHGVIGNLFHKSHAKQLILHANIPILSVHE